MVSHRRSPPVFTSTFEFRIEGLRFFTKFTLRAKKGAPLRVSTFPQHKMAFLDKFRCFRLEVTKNWQSMVAAALFI